MDFNDKSFVVEHLNYYNDIQMVSLMLANKMFNIEKTYQCQSLSFADCFINSSKVLSSSSKLSFSKKYFLLHYSKKCPPHALNWYSLSSVSYLLWPFSLASQHCPPWAHQIQMLFVRHRTHVFMLLSFLFFIILFLLNPLL